MRKQQLTRLAWIRSMCKSGAARSIRKAANLSLPEMAGAVPCAVSTLWRWEAGERLPSGKLALRYAAVVEALLEK
jgi:transcriptional regulator with XRE-family HTH domain